MPSTPITRRQRQLLELIAAYRQRDDLPLLSKLAVDMGLAGEAGVRVVLNYLIRAGLVERRSMGRGLPNLPMLTPLGEREVGMRRSGLSLWGKVPAGPWREAVQECDTVVEKLSDLLPCSSHDGFLEVEGDSLQGDGILTGDWVLVRPRARPATGDIVAAQVTEDDGRCYATLKHWHPDEAAGLVRLRSSNKQYPDLVRRQDQVEVVGVVRGLVRRLR